jgi:nucleoside triphosphate pyrophosphatase
MQLILASTSPRRKELLQQIGVPFTQLSIDINEDVCVDEEPEQYVLRLAKEKAAAGFELLSVAIKASHVVLAADTTVVCDGKILAKPESLNHSKEILRQLSGREHIVMSAIGLHSRDQIQQKIVTTKVTFRALSDAEIEAYWHSGEPQDKAGSYGIQGLGAVFVEKIEGSYSNVVGLPLCETAQLLNQFNIAFWQDSSNVGAESLI